LLFLFALGVLLAGGAAAVRGQSAPDGDEPYSIEEPEHSDDPPALAPLWGTGVSPGMVSVYGSFTSYQVNVDLKGMNITGDAANEPSIAVDPTDGNRMVIGWRQFDSITSNFRQAGWGYTTDGGATWTFAGVLENNVFRSDPVLASDRIGQFFYLSLLQSLFDDMWRSIDGGQSFTRLGPATGGDKEWFTIDNTNSIGRGYQYQFFTPNKVGQFSRSTDGGFTWLKPIKIPDSPILGTLDVDTNGNLFIGGGGLGTPNIRCVRSTDAKNGRVIPTFDQSTIVDLGGKFGARDPINPGGLNGQLFLAVDRSGSGTNNNIYVIATVRPTGFTTGTDVMFARSVNGGQTFSAPKRINDDPVDHSKYHWFATFAVAPNGRIDSVWFDTRNAANNTDSQLFYSYSTDGGTNWSPNVAVSQPFNPLLGFPNQNKIGDYITIVSDNTGGDVAYAATFNQEEDIYYVRVAPASPLPPAQALNLSTRMAVQTGDNVGIGGFIITGTAPKHLLLRGIGPSLTQSGIPNALADPMLELHSQGAFPTITNDNWRDDPVQEAAIIATGIPPSNNLEAAIDVTLNPGAYTAIARGKNNTSGVALIEVYDLSQAVLAKLANISTRAFVGTGGDIVIAGFVLGNHEGDDRVVVRGIGPSLAAFGVTNPLGDPTLELRDGNGVLLAANNDWQENPAQAAAVTAAGLAPTNAFESAIAATLPPGPYTALLAGLNGGTGIGLIEVYDRGGP
jgi:hypothetical protein